MTPDFQTILNYGGHNLLLSCFIGTSYAQGIYTFYNITAIDGSGISYTGLMRRSVRGEFIVTNLKQTG